MKYCSLGFLCVWFGSHPSRGAWIEMDGTYLTREQARVAPLTGCVD